MTLERLCGILELPKEASDAVIMYKKSHTSVLDSLLAEIDGELDDRTIEDLQKKIGEDPHGFFILAVLLSCACKTYESYREKEIPETVFVQTMKFCTRFIEEHKRIHGEYGFTWAWWFPRQLMMREFRVGELEFEFVCGDEEKAVFIHIPGDANMEEQHIRASLWAYRRFLEKYYPDWLDAEWYCESWLLSPALEQLLPENSNILKFQRLFYVESVDEESTAVLDWVYPGEKTDFANLSERTSLQKNMKKYLLKGGKVGWTKGRIKKNEI
jgi:hypothetical protein